MMGYEDDGEFVCYGMVIWSLDASFRKQSWGDENALVMGIECVVG